MAEVTNHTEHFPLDRIVPALFSQGMYIDTITEYRNEFYLTLKWRKAATTRGMMMHYLDLIALTMIILGLDDEGLEFDYSALDGRTYCVADTRNTLKGGEPYEYTA